MTKAINRLVYGGGSPPQTAAGVTTIKGTAIDTAGADGVLFACSVGTSAVDNLLKAEQSANGTTGWAELVGSVEPPNDNEIGVLIVRRPTKRYVRASLERGTSTTINEGLAVLFGISHLPDADRIIDGMSDVAVTAIDEAAEV